MKNTENIEFELHTRHLANINIINDEWRKPTNFRYLFIQ